MSVTIESAGSHAFDIGHLRQQGAVELVELSLKRAGLDITLPWRVQIQKKLFCNSETPPLRVVDGPKKWAVYIKLKPGDNNSCHYCSLLMPSGFQGQTIYPELKRIEEGIDRNWKNTTKVRTPSQADTTTTTITTTTSVENATPAMPKEVIIHEPITEQTQPIIIEQPEMKRELSVRGWTTDHERMRLILLAIDETSKNKLIHDQEHFVKLLCEKLGWQGLRRKEVGGIFTSLVRKEYICRILRGSKPIGYELTQEGKVAIKDIIGRDISVPTPTTKTQSQPTTGDQSSIILSFGPIAKQLMEANSRLEQIAIREQELVTEITGLQKERTEICKIINNKEIIEIISKLTNIRSKINA